MGKTGNIYFLGGSEPDDMMVDECICDCCKIRKNSEYPPDGIYFEEKDFYICAHCIINGLPNLYFGRDWVEEKFRGQINNKKQKVRIPKEKRWKVFKLDEFTCQYCGSQELLEVDHIIPISRGGSDDISNLQTLCETCNRKKSAKINGESSTR